MGTDKSREKPNNKLDNQLDIQEDRNDSVQSEIGMDFSCVKKDIESEEPKEDIIDKILRATVAGIASVFASAVIAGFAEVATGWSIAFGSLPMIAITAVLFMPWYWALTRMGFFRSKD